MGGATPQVAGFPENLTVAEVVDLVRVHYPNPAATAELLDRFGLSGVAGRRAGGLSGGQHWRLAAALASRVVVIARGRIIAQGSVDDITARAGRSRVSLRAPWLPELPEGTQVESSNGAHVLYTADPDGLVRALARQGVPFAHLQIERASLEEAILSLTGGTS